MFECVPLLDKTDVLNLVAEGHTRARAAAKARLHGDVEGGRKKRGVLPTFTPGIVNDVLGVIMAHPGCELKEYLDEIHTQYGVRVGVSRLSIILKELGITHKLVHLYPCLAHNSSQKKHYNETKSYEMLGSTRWHNGVLSRWFSWMNRESIRDLERELTDGGPKGHIIPYPILFYNRGNFSILPAMTMNGYIACEVYAGGINAETFNAFVEHRLIPALRAESLPVNDPNREWIVVMNNASIHRYVLQYHSARA